MTAAIREDFRYLNVSTFIDSIDTGSLYLGIGRPYAWNPATSSDSTPDTPFSTIKSINEDWEDMIALKRVFSSNTSHGIYRENWDHA